MDTNITVLQLLHCLEMIHSCAIDDIRYIITIDKDNSEVIQIMRSEILLAKVEYIEVENDIYYVHI